MWQNSYSPTSFPTPRHSRRAIRALHRNSQSLTFKAIPHKLYSVVPQEVFPCLFLTLCSVYSGFHLPERLGIAPCHSGGCGRCHFHTDENVLLSASTASGKTEAAFFPILTLFSENPPTSVGAIYIGPLKALINDQFLRLNDLCAEADIPVWHWHGDVSQSHKAKMMKHPPASYKLRRSRWRQCCCTSTLPLPSCSTICGLSSLTRCTP
ncbi:MAG: DEAD/DEAH box helicase [Ruminococcus callidus]